MMGGDSKNLVIAASPVEDLWHIAKERYLAGLDEDERALFSEATIENLHYKTNNDARANNNRKTSTTMRKLKPFIAAVQDYGEALDVIANVSPMTVAPIWGSVRVLLVVAEKHDKFYSRITDVLSRIGDIIPRFGEYGKMFELRKYPRLRQALSETYLDIITLCKKLRDTLRNQNRTSSIRRMLKPLLLEDECEEALDQFRRHKELVENEANACHMKEEAEARAIVLRNRELQELREKAEKRKALLSRLSAVDYDNKHKKMRDIRHEHSGQWISENSGFASWLESDKSSLLCIYGIPGSGKSVLVSNIIDGIKNQTAGVILIYYYCDHVDKRTLEPINILGALIRQLLELQDVPPPIETLLLSIYQDDKVADFRRVVDLFLNLLELFPVITVVLDGADELNEIDRKFILYFLDRLVKNEKSILKVLFASREDVTSSFTLPASASFRLHLQHSCLSNDIKSYVTNSIESALKKGDLVIQNAELKDIIITTLVEKAQGMFLWVKFQLDDFSNARSDAEIKRVLYNLPKNLGETYERLLGRITGEQRKHLAKRMFQWIVCAKRPLLVNELREGIAFNIDDEFYDRQKLPTDMGRLIRGCGNLVIIDESTQQVQLAHYTVRQYLLLTKPDSSARRLDNFSFEFSFVDANNDVGETAMAYLCFSDFERQISTAIDTTMSQLLTLEKTPSARMTGDICTVANAVLNAWKKFQAWRNVLPITETIDYDHVLPVRQQPPDIFASYSLLHYITENWLHHTSYITQGEHILALAREMQHKKGLCLFQKLVFKKSLPFCYLPDGYEQLTNKAAQYLGLLGWALENGHEPLLLHILEAQTTPGNVTRFISFGPENYPLISNYSCISREEYIAMMELSVSCHAPLNSMHGHDIHVLSSDQTDWAYSKLILACQRGHLDAVAILFKMSRKKLELSPRRLRWLLFEAVASGHLPMFRFVTDYISKTSVASLYQIAVEVDGEKCTVVDIAIRGAYPSIASFLLKRGYQALRFSDSALGDMSDGIRHLDKSTAKTIVALNFDSSEYKHYIVGSNIKVQSAFLLGCIETALENNDTLSAVYFVHRLDSARTLLYQHSLEMNGDSLLFIAIERGYVKAALLLCREFPHSELITSTYNFPMLSKFLVIPREKIHLQDPAVIDTVKSIAVCTPRISDLDILTFQNILFIAIDSAMIRGHRLRAEHYAAELDLPGSVRISICPLFRAVVSLSSRFVEVLIAAGADVNHIKYDSQTLVWSAITSKKDDKLETIRILAESGADLQRLALHPVYEPEQRFEQVSLLEYASVYESLEMVLYLLRSCRAEGPLIRWSFERARNALLRFEKAEQSARGELQETYSAYEALIYTTNIRQDKRWHQRPLLDGKETIERIFCT